MGILYERGLSAGGRFPPGFVHRTHHHGTVIRLYVLALKMASDANWA